MLMVFKLLNLNTNQLHCLYSQVATIKIYLATCNALKIYVCFLIGSSHKNYWCMIIGGGIAVIVVIIVIIWIRNCAGYKRHNGYSPLEGSVPSEGKKR